MKTKIGVPFVLGIVLRFLIITVAVALMLAGVNALTADQIALNAAEKKAAAVQAVLPGVTLDAARTVATESATVEYAMRDGAFAGFCVEVSPKGFGGPIRMLVGVEIKSGEKRVTGTAIISMSETAGLGTKVEDEGFLAQYQGLTDNIVLGGGDNGIDAISGATVSSKAVTAGVNAALEAITPQMIEEVGA